MCKCRVIYTLLVGLMCCLCGCNDDKPTLYVYNWSDYVDPELVARFEQENNCTVHIDTFDDNESMLAKLLAGAGGYDLIFPSSYMVPVMRKSGLLEELDMTQLKSVTQNLDRKFETHFHEDTLKYSVPYAFSVTGIVYRKDKLPKGFVVTNSWELLKSSVFGGRMSMLRDVREVMGMGLKMTGASVNSTNQADITRALVAVRKFKKKAAKLDNEQYRVGIVNGELSISMAYVCDILQIQSENPEVPIKFFVPDEGSTCCWDEMAILKKAPHKDLAYKFIDYLYHPCVAAKNAAYICTTVPNAGMWTFVDPEVKENEWCNVSKKTLEKVELIQDLGASIELYNKAWDEFTTNRD